MKIRVYVGTTEGPVAIERITREAAPNSAMCIGRSTREATASAGYEAFVKQPSGVIERELGPYSPGAFRLDVSADIGDGESWQLGVFVAHALAAEGRLAEYHEDADAAIWLTGEVANDLEVRPVGHVPDKLRASGAELAALAARGTPTTLIVPDANREHLDHAELPSAIARVAVSRIDQALEAAGLPRRASRTGDDGGTGVILAPLHGEPVRAGARRWTYAVATVLILTATASYPIAQLLSEPSSSEAPKRRPPSVSAKVDVRPAATETPPPAIDQAPVPAAAAPAESAAARQPRPRATPPAMPPRPDIRLVIRERRAPAGATCALVHLRRIAAERIEVRRAAPDRFAASRHDGLCGLEFAIVNAGAPAYVTAFTTMISGGFLNAGPAPDVLRGATPFEGEASWRVDIARRLAAPIEYRLDVVVSDRPATAAANAGTGVVVAVHRARHRIEP